MRGADSYNENLFTTVRLEEFVPANHPLRPIRERVNDALAGMNAQLGAMYEADIKGGRPSIAPEKLMRAMRARQGRSTADVDDGRIQPDAVAFAGTIARGIRPMNEQLVTVDPDIHSGTPVFAGTRVPVTTLFDHLKAGDSLEVFLNDFPSVSREQAVAVLEEAGAALIADAHPA